MDKTDKAIDKIKKYKIFLIINVLIIASIIYWYETRIGNIAVKVFNECIKEAQDYAKEQTNWSNDNYFNRQQSYDVNYGSYYTDCLLRLGFQKEASKAMLRNRDIYRESQKARREAFLKNNQEMIKE